MCLWPTIIHNPKYKESKKNGGIIPPFTDERVLRVPIGCGHCMECKKQRARELQIRLLEDIKHNTNGKFVTLTFSNESIAKIAEAPPSIKFPDITLLKGYQLDNAIATYAQYHFNERWRKEFKKALRHIYITELGHEGTENIHLHGIVWTNESYETIARIWQYGFIWPTDENERKNAYVNGETVNYIIKYITKRDEDHKNYEPIILTSAGIGRDYITKGNGWTNKYTKNTKETYTTDNGYEIIMPVYWRNKIYSEEQREQLWIKKLDKLERYVNGVKIDISKNEKRYYIQLEKARKLNDQLGYGNNKLHWKREEYEQARRQLRIEERIQNAKAINTIRTKKENDELRKA